MAIEPCKHTWGNWHKMSSTWGSVDIASICSSCGSYRFWVKKKEVLKEKVRANKQIWKLAEWIYWNAFDFSYPACERFCVHWNSEDTHSKNHFYDKASELLKKLANNEFTGRDNHED